MALSRTRAIRCSRMAAGIFLKSRSILTGTYHFPENTFSINLFPRRTYSSEPFSVFMKRSYSSSNETERLIFAFSGLGGAVPRFGLRIAMGNLGSMIAQVLKQFESFCECLCCFSIA
jgi:hypothetical protein